MLLVLCFISVSPYITQEPTPPTPPAQNASNNPVLALYERQAQANYRGWTASDHREVGEIYVILGDYTAAAAHWEQVEAPDANLLGQLTQLYIETQQWPQASATLERLIALNPNDGWANFHLAMILAPFDPIRAQGYLETAIESNEYRWASEGLLRVLQTAPDDPLLSMRVGLVLANQEQWPFAEQAFRHAAALAHPYPEALAYVGLSRVQQGKSSISWITQALEFGAESDPVHYIHGLYLRSEGDHEHSLQAFARAAELDPNNPAYYAEIGNAYQLLFDYEAAEYWLRVALAASNNALDFQEMLAVFYAEEGYRFDNDRLSILAETQDALPDDPDLIAGFAWAMHTMGDTQTALSQLDMALESAPENVAALFYRARILADQGDYEQAAMLMERVLGFESAFSEDATALVELWRVVPMTLTAQAEITVEATPELTALPQPGSVFTPIPITPTPTELSIVQPEGTPGE